VTTSGSTGWRRSETFVRRLLVLVRVVLSGGEGIALTRSGQVVELFIGSEWVAGS